MERPSRALDDGMGAVMVKRVLMIAYHFPPLTGSSGIQRTLTFTRYLPEYGWEPLVLTTHPRAYPLSSHDQLTLVPQQLTVRRAFALDAARHLSFKGRYPGFLAVPDRWSSWLAGAIPAGLQMIRHLHPDIIWSTYPIASAHAIAYCLHRLTGIPWIADFRDPMVEEHYPVRQLTRRTYGWIEAQALKYCAKAVLVTPGALRDYRTRFHSVPASRFSLIENGYDESAFSALPPVCRPPGSRAPFVLLHSGIVYPHERDPIPFFDALAELQAAKRISPESFNVVLRAPGNEPLLQRLIDERRITDIVRLLPAIPYQEALREMCEADGLLLLQAANSNNQIPAKLYEYLRAQRPILALTDTAGDTAGALGDFGIDTIAPLDRKDAIVSALQRFVALVQRGAAPIAPMNLVLRHSRRTKSELLAQTFDEVIGLAQTGCLHPQRN